MPQNFMVFRFRFGNARNGFLRNNQNVNRRLRFDVVKGENEVIFVNDLRRNFPGCNFFKKSFAHRQTSHETSNEQESFVSAWTQLRRNSRIWFSMFRQRELQRCAPTSCFTQSRSPLNEI